MLCKRIIENVENKNYITQHIAIIFSMFLLVITSHFCMATQDPWDARRFPATREQQTVEEERGGGVTNSVQALIAPCLCRSASSCVRRSAARLMVAAQSLKKGHDGVDGVPSVSEMTRQCNCDFSHQVGNHNACDLSNAPRSRSICVHRQLLNRASHEKYACNVIPTTQKTK